MPLFEISGNRGYNSDKAKGIVCKPMPRDWYDRHAVNKIEDEEKKRFYRSIVADKKPYFMRYIYPALMKQYNTYIRNTNRNALREFQMTMDELMAIPEEQLTERQADFLRYYNVRMPVGIGDCVMNKICRRFEEKFDGFVGKVSAVEDFNYTILKSGAEYTYSQKLAVQKLYAEYNRKMQEYVVFSRYQRVDDDECAFSMSAMKDDFIRQCEDVCQNRETLCDIMLDVCYCRSSSKKFAWDICGSEIVQNLLTRSGGVIHAPVKSQDGEIEYCAERYTVISKVIGGIE